MYEFSPLTYTLQILFLPVLYSLVAAFLFSLVARAIFKGLPFLKVFGYYTGFGVPVSLVAFSAGFLTGISRAPAVGTVLPAILTLVAGLGVYVFGTDNRYKVVVGYCVSILIVMLFVGMQTGAFQREGQH